MTIDTSNVQQFGVSPYYYQYQDFLRLQGELEQRLKDAIIQKRQNDICLLARKRRLFTSSFNFLSNYDYDVKCRAVRKYLDDIREKKVNRRTRCDGKTAHEELCSVIRVITGIDVKHITDIIFINHDDIAYCIDFVERKYGKELRLHIPNVKCGAYYIDVDDVLKDDFETKMNYALCNLTMSLEWIKSKKLYTEAMKVSSIELVSIASFPEDVDMADKLSRKYDEFVFGRHLITDEVNNET